MKQNKWVQLPVAPKAKLMRQVLVQKEGGLYSGVGPGRMVDSRPKDLLAFLCKPLCGSYKGWGVACFLYPIILLAFSMLSLQTSPYSILANGGYAPGLHVYGVRVRGQ